VSEGVAVDQFTTVIEGSGVVAVEPGAVDGPGLRARVVPNPFRSQAFVRVDLDRDASVRLAVHDAAGRLVRHLVDDATMGAGAHVVSWDGRDDDGRELASGAYFYRLESGEEVVSGRMTLLR
jgi:flagellar hook assembly protein FlgD